MRNVFQILLYFIGLLIIFIAGFCAFIILRGVPKYEVQKVDFPKVEITAQRVETGAKIAAVQCMICHMGNDHKLSGRLVREIPPEFGEIHSANITQSKENGIGGWTDAEIAVMLRTGLKKDGQFAPFYMPKFCHLSDEDLKSVIAWLRSDQQVVQASATPTVKSTPSFLTKLLCFVAFKPYDYPGSAIPDPDTSNALLYGKYLVTGRYDCYTCHSQDFKTLRMDEPEKSAGYCQGGNAVFNPEGKPVFSANITPDEKTGIGSWTESDFVRAMKESKRKDGKALRNPMLPYNSLTAAEIHAIWTYLRSIPALSNEVNRQWDKDL